MIFPLSLQHARRRMRDCHPAARVMTLTPEGTVSASFGEVCERVDRLARALKRRDRAGRSRGDVRMEQPAPLRALHGGPMHRGRAAHAQHPPVRRAGHLHRQPCRGPGDLRRRLARAAAGAAGADLRGCAPFRNHGRRRRRQSPQRVALRGAPGGGGAGALRAYPELDERQAASLCYTSGTTGNPKGVLYSHRSICLHCDRGADRGQPRPLAPRPCARGRADVPRQRLGAAVRRGAVLARTFCCRTVSCKPSRWRARSSASARR